MYYVYFDGKSRGPYMLDQIKSMWASGTLTANDTYWCEPENTWKPVFELLAGNTLVSPPENATAKPPCENAATPSIEPRAANRSPGGMWKVHIFSERLAKWPQIRALGRSRFIWVHGYLSYAIPVCVGGTIITLTLGRDYNIYAQMGDVFAMVVGTIWLGYRHGKKQWNAYEAAYLNGPGATPTPVPQSAPEANARNEIGSLSVQPENQVSTDARSEHGSNLNDFFKIAARVVLWVMCLLCGIIMAFLLLALILDAADGKGMNVILWVGAPAIFFGFCSFLSFRKLRKL